MIKKILFIGFSDIQIELARKFIMFRNMSALIEVFSESSCPEKPDAYVINGDEAASVARLGMHVRAHPAPVLGIGSRPAQSVSVFAAGAFKPASVDRLAEMLASPSRVALPVLQNAVVPVKSQIVAFPKASARVMQSEVLVVDDSEMVRRTLLRKINEYGQAVDMAANGEEAMAMLLNNRYKIVFLDVTMPGIDGLEICRRIKRSVEYKESAVYMLTSRDGMFDRVRATMAGCDGYLVKPLESRKLREVIERHFDRPSELIHSSVLSREPFNAAEIAAIEGRPSKPIAPNFDFKTTFAATQPYVANKFDKKS
jgi:two-component system, cell cycle response regulator